MSTTTMVPRMKMQFRAFRAILLTILVLLVPQFVLGMITNIYLPLPATLHGNAAGWDWALSQPVVTAHITLGTLIVVLSVVAVVIGIFSRRLATVIFSSLGCILLLITWIGGDEFLGSRSNVDSTIMAFGFMAALLVYGVAYHVTGSGSAD